METKKICSLPKRLPFNHPDYDDCARRRLLSQCKWVGGCLVWTGALDSNGYGKISYKGGTVVVHRLFYELIYPALPFPKGLDFSHTCGDKLCMLHGHPDTRSGNMMYDCSGHDHPGASVPNHWLPSVVEFYHKNPNVTQKKIAEMLTDLGFPTARATVGRWVNGRCRSQNLN